MHSSRAVVIGVRVTTELSYNGRDTFELDHIYNCITLDSHKIIHDMYKCYKKRLGKSCSEK